MEWSAQADRRVEMVGRHRPSHWMVGCGNRCVLDVLDVTETTDQTLDVPISDTPTVGSVDPKARDVSDVSHRPAGIYQRVRRLNRPNADRIDVYTTNDAATAEMTPPVKTAEPNPPTPLCA